MKIAILNDTHFGARNDSSIFLNYFFRFFDEVFFPYIKSNHIDTIFHLGDLMDRRKYVNFNTLTQVKANLFDKIETMGVDLHMLLGNHDTFYRNTNEVNSPKQLFSHYKSFHLYEECKLLNFDGLSIGMVPWICTQNKDEVLNFIKNTTCPILCGHFELNNYEVLRGVKFSGGMTDSFLGRFEQVLSGHFHNKSENKNVKYLGTQYEITFSDMNDMKGFHVLDTETRELTFIENPDKMFYSINPQDDIVDYSVFKNKYVKLIVTSDCKRTDVDDKIFKIEQENPYEFTIIEDMSLDQREKDPVDLSKDTLTIINEEIDSLEIDINTGVLKKIANEIYLEALDQ
jgi:DNA repair exonuclease SbcCD nuclease subunit